MAPASTLRTRASPWVRRRVVARPCASAVDPTCPLACSRPRGVRSGTLAQPFASAAAIALSAFWGGVCAVSWAWPEVRTVQKSVCLKRKQLRQHCCSLSICIPHFLPALAPSGPRPVQPRSLPQAYAPPAFRAWSTAFEAARVWLLLAFRTWPTARPAAAPNRGRERPHDKDGAFQHRLRGSGARCRSPPRARTMLPRPERAC